MIKRIIFGVVVGVFLLLLTSCIIMFKAPQFGEKPTDDKIKEYAISRQYNLKEQVFENRVPTVMNMGFIKGISVMWKFIRGVEHGSPEDLLPVISRDSYTAIADSTYITWFGHSAILLEIEGKNIFLDPMLGLVPSPYDFLGSSRFNPKLPTTIENLPDLDAVVISHDHYDHLDYGTVKAIKEKVKHWFVPLGVENHLVAWGVDAKKIHTLDWGESAPLSDTINIICTPARHFSGRSLTDRNSTLWSSWIIKGKAKNIFFSGDGGYWNGFKDIGKKYGPFDFAMVECGQYNKRWSNIHMFPEQSVQALQDLNAKIGMPIHWGAFKLSLHTWDDSPKRFSVAAKKKNQEYISPIIGEKINLDAVKKPTHWWDNFK